MIVVSVGRRPRTHGLGLDAVGIEFAGVIEIDGCCRAGDGVGNRRLHGVAQFTHVSKYQAHRRRHPRSPVQVDYRAAPRVLTRAGGRVRWSHGGGRPEQGIDAVSAVIDPPTSIARPYTYEEDPKGTFAVIADRERGVLVGAWAIAPLAGEWIHQAVLAIRAEIPLPVLKDTIQQFPTFSEAFGLALRRCRTRRC